jgi:hypothetical protein
MPGFGPASAPVASCGVWGFLEAPDSYKFDYNGLGWTPPVISLMKWQPYACPGNGDRSRRVARVAEKKWTDLDLPLDFAPSYGRRKGRFPSAGRSETTAAPER